MEQEEIIKIIKTKENWSSKDLIDLIKKETKKKIKIIFYHIGGYECLRDGTKEDVCNSLEEIQNVLNDHDIEYDTTITNPYVLVESIKKEWIEMHDDGGGSGWIDY